MIVRAGTAAAVAAAEERFAAARAAVIAAKAEVARPHLVKVRSLGCQSPGPSGVLTCFACLACCGRIELLDRNLF